MAITFETSQLIAIKGLQYLAGDEEQLGRFLNLTGCNLADLRQNAGSPEFLAGILEFFMGNEPTLLAFCAQHSIDPEAIAGAQQRLAGEENQINNQFSDGHDAGGF